MKRYRKSTILIGILLGILFFTSISHANFIEDTTLTFRKKLTFDYQLPKQVEKILETDYKDLEIFDNADYAYVFDFYKRKPDFSRSQFSDVKTTNLHFMGIADFNGDNSEDLVILTKNKFTHQKSLLFFEYIDKNYISTEFKINIETPVLTIKYVKDEIKVITAAGKGYASEPDDLKSVLIKSDYISFYYSIVAYIDDQYQQIWVSD